MNFKTIVFLLCLCPLLAQAAEVTTLFDAYQKAQQYDATLRAAQAANTAQQQEIDMAIAQFLPQASISAFKGRAVTEISDKSGTTEHPVYESQNYNFTVRQSVFNQANFAGYSQAKAVAAHSDAILERERLSLMSRVTGSYLNLLLAAEFVQYGAAQKASVASQLEQAKRRYQAGVGTVTEISEAAASLDSVIAQEIEWANGLEYTKSGLEKLTGSYPESYLTLDSTKLPLTGPDPAKVEDWIETSNSKNPDILAALNDLEAARQQVSKQNSGHFPTLDLVASRALAESGDANTIGRKTESDSIGFQLNVPLYSGGYVNATVRQAVARQEEAQEKLSEKQRAVAVDVRKYFNEVMNSIARIQALGASVKSYELALIGTQKGFAAGVRTNVDVLNAQEKLYSSRRDLAEQRYRLIYNRIYLKQLAGLLTASDIQETSGWLTMPPGG